MRFRVHGDEIGDGNAGVELRGAKALVSKLALHRREVRAVGDEMRGARVREKGVVRIFDSDCDRANQTPSLPRD